MSEYNHNAPAVLGQLDRLIAEGEAKVQRYKSTASSWRAKNATRGIGKVRIRDVCDRLSIFDWWGEELSLSQMRDMRTFLCTAIQLGYNKYVCFKVGATGCANGMWAHKDESTTGYSPDGENLYRSFTPDYLTWDAQLPDGSWVSEHIPPSEKKDDGRHMTIAQVKQYLVTHNGCRPLRTRRTK